MKLVRVVLSAAIVLMLLCGCAVEQPEQTLATTAPPVAETTTAPTAPPLPTVTVRFWAMGQVIAEQQVAEGRYPDMEAVDLSGLVFSRWTDRDGNEAVPELTLAYEDASYYAQAYPAFTNHVPYLFPDDNGDIRAEDALTGDELAAALQALASEEAVAYLLRMPRGNAEESVGSVREVLNDYFPMSAIREVFDGLDDEPMSRGAFAHIMNRLLGRGGGEAVALGRNPTVPADLETDSQNFFDILEATVPHTREETGTQWSAALLDMRWKPGFFHIDGCLYYADEDGVLARDTVVDGLTFGPDGRFTGDDE